MYLNFGSTSLVEIFRTSSSFSDFIHKCLTCTHKQDQGKPPQDSYSALVAYVAFAIAVLVSFAAAMTMVNNDLPLMMFEW